MDPLFSRRLGVAIDFCIEKELPQDDSLWPEVSLVDFFGVLLPNAKLKAFEMIEPLRNVHHLRLSHLGFPSMI